MFQTRHLPDAFWFWRYHLGRRTAQWDLTPAHIAMIYAAFGLLALYVSDVLLVELVRDAEILRTLQAAKGGAEVVVTAGLIFVLTRRSRQTLEMKNDSLEKQRSELEVLHRVLRHNLRNDINVIRGHLQQLCRTIESGPEGEWCAAAIGSTNRVMSYVRKAGKIHHASQRSGTSTIDLREAVRRALKTVDTGGASVTVFPDDDTPLRVEANPMIGDAIAELVSNAIDHNESPSPEVSISFAPDREIPHMAVLRVVDDGPGIPEYELEALEKRVEDQLVHLSGMGLWFVMWTVESSNGTVTIENHDAGGCTVELRLPRAAV